MWKAFEELEAMGWIGSKRPRMVAVQSDGCAPIARAFHSGAEFAEPWKDAATMASGIRVPAAVGDFLMLRALRESGGTAVTVSDAEIDAATRLTTSLEGLFVCPEGGAVVAGLQKLIAQGWVRPDERVVVFNTGTGLKYPECFPVDLPVLDPREPIDYATL
jgi:threonine synthase